jgi:hypothetical protein
VVSNLLRGHKIEATVAQIEYGDYYKFVVSLGIALVIAAILVPWLFLREPFDLMIEAARLSQLTPAAQRIVLLRQANLLRLLPMVPWFSCFSLIIGILLAFTGLAKWRERQILRDTSEDLGVKKQEQELRSMTAEEVTEKTDAESEPEVRSHVIGLTHDVFADKLRVVESAFYDKVRQCLGTSYRLLINQTLGTAEYDAILQAIRPTDPDVVVEIKYIRQGFKYAWLRESAMRLALADQLYNAKLKRDSVPLLLVIFSVGELSQQSEVQKLRAKAQADLRQRGAGVRVEYLSDAGIPNMPCEELKRLILG